MSSSSCRARGGPPSLPPSHDPESGRTYLLVRKHGRARGGVEATHMVTKTPRNAVQSGAIVDDAAGLRRGRGRQRTAFFSAAARSVRSHVKSVADTRPFLMVCGVRPKCP